MFKFVSCSPWTWLKTPSLARRTCVKSTAAPSCNGVHLQVDATVLAGAATLAGVCGWGTLLSILVLRRSQVFNLENRQHHGFNLLAWGRIVGDGTGGEFPEWTFGWYDSFRSKALLLTLAEQCLTQAEVTALTASQLVDFWRPERCSEKSAQKCSLVTWCSSCP